MALKTLEVQAPLENLRLCPGQHRRARIVNPAGPAPQFEGILNNVKKGMS